MVRRDTGWRPEGTPEYDGHSVYFHNIAPEEVNVGEVDGDIAYDEELLDESLPD